MTNEEETTRVYISILYYAALQTLLLSPIVLKQSVLQES